MTVKELLRTLELAILLIREKRERALYLAENPKSSSEYKELLDLYDTYFDDSNKGIVNCSVLEAKIQEWIEAVSAVQNDKLYMHIKKLPKEEKAL